MEKLKKNILKQVALGMLSKEEAKELIVEMKSDLKVDENNVAIIGIAARFPDAVNYSEYWDNLIHNKVSIKDFPEDRIDNSKETNDNELFGYRKGGFLNSIDEFDAPFFNIAPNEAKFMNPVQRLFLEVSYEAIEDAGYAGNRINSSKTGVYAGIDHTSNPEYTSKDETDPLSITGSWTGILASRVSYVLDLKGPSVVIDTACSSGLSAVHMACNAINNGECDMAISGGICLNTIQDLKVDKLAMLTSEDETVRAFDKYANGTMWGEGTAVVLLKSLAKAVQDRDNVYAVIKGSSMNNNGTSNGITALDAKAQEMLYMDAWKRANINPETISYIETHGTGTVIGDHIEIKGLTNAFKNYTNRKQFCGIGSVKANIGHTVGTSGVASLIKTILALNNKKIPATLNFSEPNSYSRFCDGPLYVADMNRDWVTSQGCLRHAGVSSFGFNGTNVHVVLEEMNITQNENNMCCYEIVFLSAMSVKALNEKIKQYKWVLASERDINLANLAYTTNTGRKHHSVRAAVIFSNKSDLINKLHALETALCNDFDNGIFYGECSKERVNLYITNGNVFFYNSIFYHAEQGIMKKNQLWKVLVELGQHYIKGKFVDWDYLYAGVTRNKASLPTYPFEKKRYWIDSLNKINKSTNNLIQSRDEQLQLSSWSSDDHVNSQTIKTIQDIGYECNVKNKSTKLEEKIGQIYIDILGIQEIDVNDNFYDLGGNSILVINLETKLKNLGYNIDMQVLQNYNTVSKLAGYIKQQKPNFTSDIKESLGIIHKTNETIIRGLHGFNPIFYKYCFYNSLFSIVFKLRGNIYPFLSNDVMVYSLNTGASFNDSFVNYKCAYTVKSLLSQMKVNVDVFSHHSSKKIIKKEEEKFDFSLDNFEKDLGWSCYETDECDRSILKDIKRAVEQKHYILLWIDAYYVSIRADTYNKLHLPHVLLIYGFKDDEDYFITMEHSAKDLLSYKKRYISYDDVYNSYKGFLINFKGSSTIATYHEIYAESRIYDRKQEEHVNIYKQNLLINKNDVNKGLAELTDFIRQINGGMHKDQLSIKTATDWLEKINSIVNGKSVERYQISNLFGKSYEPLKLINENIELWLMVRNIIAKFIFSERYDTNSMSDVRKMLEQITFSEDSYYYHIYNQ